MSALRRTAWLAAGLLLGVPRPGVAQAVAVPSVGCPAYGMAGPVAAPAAPPAGPPVAVAAAERLAYYVAPAEAVLAPRGWHCVEIYGSDGAMLLVTPRSYEAAPPDIGSLAGPAVELAFLNGENSGRDEVATVFSRLFPARRGFIRGVAAEYDPPRRYPRGPFPADRTVRRDRGEVDYTTPPRHRGMGTSYSYLGPGAGPIEGAAMLSSSNGVDSVVLVDVRLPPGLRGLAPVILGAARTAEADEARAAAQAPK